MSDQLPPISGRSAPPMPMPGPDAQAHSERLIQLIQQQIAAAGGALPFDQYMESALYAPGLGYYTAGARKFGEAGDFITAPESSPLFAGCLAHQCQQVLEQLHGGSLLEVGAGSGIMAADLLLALERLSMLPDHYLILELSPDLKKRQHETLSHKAAHLLPLVTWVDTLPGPGFRGVVVANELLDAMPVSRFRLDNGVLFEQAVRWQNEKFSPDWVAPVTDGLVAAVEPVLKLLGSDVDDFESEVNLRLDPWLNALGEMVTAGAVILIDYGHPRGEYYHPQRSRGTLMCYYRHRAHDNPYAVPGLQDITAHVDFTAVAEAGLRAGFSLAGYTTQAYFLMATGLDQLMAQSDPSDVKAHMVLAQGVKRLTLPSEMGEQFKVIGFSKGLDVALQGFSMRDFCERL